MALRINKNRTSPIAVDFGADALKLLQLDFGEPHRLVAAASSVVPGSARNDPAARKRFIEQALRDQLRSQPFKGRRAVLSIPAFQTLIHHLEVPGNDTSDLESKANVELQSRLGLHPNQLVIRHQHVGQVTRDGKTMQRVLCMAAPRDTVMGYVDLANRLKLEVAGVQAEPPCIVRAFAEAYNRREQDATRVACHIDIGAAATKVVISKGYELTFARLIHAGGDHLTRTAASQRKCEFMVAREQRVNEVAWRRQAASGEVTAEASTAIADDRRASFDRVTSLDHEAYDCIIDEVSLAIRYYNDIHRNHPVDVLVFCGGEAHDLDVCRALAQSLNLPAQLGDPLVQVERNASLTSVVSAGTPHPDWAVAMGLCFGEDEL